MKCSSCDEPAGESINSCWGCDKKFCDDCSELCHVEGCGAHGCVEHVFSCPKCGNIACPDHRGKYPDWYDVCDDCLKIPSGEPATEEVERDDSFYL